MMPNRDILLKQASGILQNAHDLSPEDRRIWDDRLNSASSDILKLFIHMFENDTKDLSLAMANLKSKIASDGDSEKIQKIIEDEKRVLKESIKQENNG